MSGRQEKVIDRFGSEEAPVVIGVLQVCRDRLRVGKSFGRRGRSVQRGAVELLLQLGVGGRLKPDEKLLVHRSISPGALSWFSASHGAVFVQEGIMWETTFEYDADDGLAYLRQALLLYTKTTLPTPFASCSLANSTLKLQHSIL